MILFVSWPPPALYQPRNNIYQRLRPSSTHLKHIYPTGRSSGTVKKYALIAQAKKHPWAVYQGGKVDHNQYK